MQQKRPERVSLEPVEDRIVILPDDAEKSWGRIMLPDKSIKPSCRGEVMAVGPGRCVGINSEGNLVYAPIGVKVGDRVIFQWAGAEVPEDGVKYIILRMPEVLSIVRVSQEFLPGEKSDKVILR